MGKAKSIKEAVNSFSVSEKKKILAETFRLNPQSVGFAIATFILENWEQKEEQIGLIENLFKKPYELDVHYKVSGEFIRRSRREEWESLFEIHLTQIDITLHGYIDNGEEINVLADIPKIEETVYTILIESL